MDAQSTPAIAVDRLVKRYKAATAVDGISFRLAPGTVTGLLGGNGAGKTTTIAMIMGLVTPTSGTVSVLGAAMPRERHRVSEDLPRGLVVRMPHSPAPRLTPGQQAVRTHVADQPGDSPGGLR